ncbi:MAG TPA: PBP1A family penicillin-binding protein [Polyangiaceae bacterium]
MRLSAREILESAPPVTTDRTWKGRWERLRPGLIYWGKRAGIAFAALSLLGAITAFSVIHHYEADLPSVTELKGNYHPPQVTRVLARDGTLLAELFTERRTVVPINSLPPHVKLAVLAAEDAGFYEHEGLNYWGMARAFLKNLRAGHTRQGGSTITQQVVRNVLLEDTHRTFARKMREMLLSGRLESELSKDEILELYINFIYLGRGRYGIEEAARDDFGKSAKDLTIAEAALLAGRISRPESCSPRRDMKCALMRRTFVLDQMHAKSFLPDAAWAQAKEEPVRLAPEVEAKSELAPEAVEIARKMLRDLAHDQASRGGFTITTTIDPRLQEAARKSIRDDLMAYDKRHGVQGALKVPPPVTTAARKGHAPPPAKDAPFEGTPTFESHKVYVGVVVEADDPAGAFDVRVGTVTGTVRMADVERYNPGGLVASAFAPVGAHARVSLLAPVPASPEGAPQADGASALRAARSTPEVPLRLESGPEGALVAIDVRSRQVLALVGNYEAVSGGLDRATQSHRQPGSTFKPIVYSYALHSRRYTPATLVDVTPATFAGGYHPSNYEGWKDSDPLRLREALAHSVNVVAVRVLDDVGPANVVQWGESLGIRSTLKPDLSLALGSYEVEPIELAGAYATFAAGGEYDEPRIITRIVGPDGKEIPLPPLPPPRRVLDEAESYVVTDMLKSVIDHGTGQRAKELRRPVAGKTGTSNLSKDTWFAGYTPELTTVVWVGYDDGKPLGGAEQGSVTALPAWVSFMKVANDHKPPSEFPQPPGVVTVEIDAKSGKLPYPGDTETLNEVFLAGTEPTEVANPYLPEDGGAPDDGAAP